MSDLSKFAEKKVLVSGASGFIGLRLCNQLYNLGATVHAISRTPQINIGNHVQWWEADLTNSERIQSLFRTIKPDITFHLASLVTGGRELCLVLPTLNGNLASTVNILVAATENSCERIIIAGSLEEPSEEGKAIPSSPYAAAKWASSGYARMFHALYGTPVVIARIFMVYGPGQWDLRKLIPYVTVSLLRQETPKLSSGQRPVDWIYVDDVVNGLLHMGISPGTEGTTLDLGSGNLIPTRRVVEKLCHLLNTGIQPGFGVLPERPMERVSVADIKETHKKLGWQPEISIEHGLNSTIEWYKQQIKLGNIH